MKAEETKSLMGVYLAPKEDKDQGLLAMFRYAAREPYGIHVDRLPGLQGHFKIKIARSISSDPAREGYEASLAEIDRAIAELKKFKIEAPVP